MQLRRSLCFASSGARAAIRSERGVHVVELGDGRPPMLHEIERVHDIAAVGAELWIAAGASPRLHRIARDGRLTAEQALWGDDGVLRPTTNGEPGALWSEPPATVLLANRKTVVLGAPADLDCIIPISQTRWVACRRDSVSLRDPGTERWSVTIPSGGSRVLDGVALFGGRTLALVLAAGQALTQLLVLSLHDGGVQHRITLSGIELVRFAPARGYALLRAGADTVMLLDLRFGHVLKEHRELQAFVDAAIDPAGQSYMIRFGASQDDVAIGAIRDLLAMQDARKPAPRLEVVPASAEPGAPDPAAGPEASSPEPAARAAATAATARTAATATDSRGDAAIAPAGFHEGHRELPIAHLLAPRPQTALAMTEVAVALLERYREVIAAMTGAAIARAWDEGRLSAPVEDGLPFHAEVAGLRGRAGGRAAEDVAEASREVDDALAAVRAYESLLGPTVTPLAALAAEFALPPAAQLILLAVAAPALWGELARLYGILSNDLGRPLVDELLIAQILEPHAARHDIAAELDRDAPLVRRGLVHVGRGGMRPFLPLTCDAIVLRLLRGAACDVELKDIRVVASYRQFDQLLIPAAVKSDIAERLAREPRSEIGRIVVRGRSGAGRHALLAAIAGRAQRRLAIFDATTVLRDLRQRSDELVHALRRANLVGLLPCVDGLEQLPSDDPAARDLVRQILDDHPGPLALHLPLDAEPPLAPGYLALDLPPLSMEQRTASWRILLAEHGLAVRDPDDLADRFRIGPAVIARACAQVAATAATAATAAIGGEPAGAEPADAGLALERAVRQHLDVKLRATASRVERLASWSRVILPPDIQESVLELIARIKHRRTVFDAWGMGEVMTSSRGVTALFQGGPGTGKTLVASAIANELGMDLYRVDLSRIMSKWIGETEQNLARLFDAAEDGHAIVLFDEADSLFARRTEVKSSVDRYANLEVNFLLQRLDSFEGIAILTTNFGTSIDAAFKRRLSFRLTFPFPDEDAREALWRSHLPAQLPRAGAFDLGELARRYRLSGGYIRNAALRAAFLAAEEHTPLTHDHLERAIKAEFREIGKIAESGILE